MVQNIFYTEDNECALCITRDNIERMIEVTGLSFDDAFHISVINLVEGLVEEALEEVFEEGRALGRDEGASDIYAKGFEDGKDFGYKEGVRDLEEIVTSYSDNVHADED